MSQPPTIGWNVNPGAAASSNLYPSLPKESDDDDNEEKKCGSGSKNKRRSASSSSSTSTSSSSDSDNKDRSQSRELKRKLRKEAKRLKKEQKRQHKREKKEHKKAKRMEKKQKKMDRKAQEDRLVQDNEEEEEADCGPPISLMNTKARAPQTKEDYDKAQSYIRRVVDPESGRTRLIKGDGEILEEIVTRDRHKAINKQATKADGEFFKSRTVGWASD